MATTSASSSAASSERLSQPAVDARAWGVLAVLCVRLRAELPRPAAAVDPGQADPGLAAHHRRPARADRRALFRLLLLLHRDPGRLARRPHQPRDRAVARLRDLERGDDGLRLARHLSAARRRAHDGRLRRGGRRAAVLRADHRHLSARPARHGVRHLQSRPADRRGARHRVRRVDRRGVRLARRLHRDRRRSASSRPRSVRLFVARAGARRASTRTPRASAKGGASGDTLRDVLLAARRSMLAALGSGATQFITYGLGNFADAVPDAREGHDAGGGGGLVRARRRRRHGRGDGRLGPGDRPADAAIARPPTPSLPALSLALALPFYVAFVWAPTWPLALVFLTGR